MYMDVLHATIECPVSATFKAFINIKKERTCYFVYGLSNKNKRLARF